AARGHGEQLLRVGEVDGRLDVDVAARAAGRAAGVDLAVQLDAAVEGRHRDVRAVASGLHVLAAGGRGAGAVRIRVDDHVVSGIQLNVAAAARVAVGVHHH